MIVLGRAFGRIRWHASWRASQNEVGAILVLWTVALTAILGFVALAINMGNDVQSSTNIQNAVAWAAIAGASQLTDRGTDISRSAGAGSNLPGGGGRGKVRYYCKLE